MHININHPVYTNTRIPKGVVVIYHKAFDCQKRALVLVENISLSLCNTKNLNYTHILSGNNYVNYFSICSKKEYRNFFADVEKAVDVK